MKKIFTTDVEGTVRFLEAIDFGRLFRPEEFGQKNPNAILPGDEYEVVCAKRTTRLAVRDSFFGSLGQQLLREFGFSEGETIVIDAYSGMMNYSTPLGFTFSIIVSIA